MKYLRYMALLAALAVLSPLGAFARDKNQHSVEIPETVQIGSTQLQPGTYKLEWQGTGAQMQVSFVRHGKTVATLPGTLTTNDGASVQDAVVTDTASDNTKTLREIDFGREKLVFTQSGM
jgi:hypothetical protein